MTIQVTVDKDPPFSYVSDVIPRRGEVIKNIQRKDTFYITSIAHRVSSGIQTFVEVSATRTVPKKK